MSGYRFSKATATEMEWRVACALFAHDEGMLGGGNLENCHEGWHSDMISRARAAIRAMREPTDAMLDAPNIVMDEPWNIKVGWHAMIDAASPQEE